MVADITKGAAAKELKARRLARRSLLDFVSYTHGFWQTGAHHRLICEALERVERGECRRLLIEAPPRHSKSELASRRFPAWWIGRRPRDQIISASYNDLVATDIGRDVRNIVRDTRYSKLFPDVALAEDSAAAGRWHTGQGGSYLATGVGGTMTGYGANLAIIDDAIKNREEADSERTRENIWHWYTSTFYTRLMPGGAIVMMTTRWHEDDLAARVQQSETWEVLKLPAISDNKALWPEWYPLDELRKIQEVLPPRDWQALYQQEPRADVGTYCQRAWFNERYTDPPARRNVYIVTDPAISEAKEGKKPDYTEHGVFGMAPNGNLYVLDWWSGQVTSDVWADELLRLIKKWRPICWFGEGGVIGKASQPLIRALMRERHIYSRTELLSPIHDKASRGRSFQGMAHAGRVIFPHGEWAERVINQCVAFPGGTNDDAFDVCAWMCLAIDQAHPAIVPAEIKPPKRHDYGRKKESAGWKVV